MEWLHEIPLGVIEAHVEMMSRIRAREGMAAATAAGVGRSFKPGRWAWRQMEAWRRQATVGNRPAERASPATLRALGIGVRGKRG